MPILKSLGVGDPKVPRAGTLPLRSSRNPFEDSPALEEETGESGRPGTLPNGTSCGRRATLEKLAGLAHFRLGWTSGRRAGSPGDGQGRSFLGRVLAPGIRRSSADFGLLTRLQGFRTHGDEEPAGETARRLAFLRLGRGPKPRRASLAERVVPAGEAAPEPPPKVQEPPKMKEPLSVLEILGLIQKRELARADEHILELEAEAPAEAEAGGGRRARDVALLYEALQRELWALVREALAAPGPGAGAVAQLGRVLQQEEAADARRGPGAARKLRARWAEAVARAARERLEEAAAPGARGALAGQLEALRARLLEDVAAVRGRLAPAYPAGLRAGAVYLRGYHEALAEWLGAAARRRLPLADRYALLHWHHQVYPREILGLVDVVALENGELGPLLSAGTLRGLEDECVTDVKAQTRAALLRVLQEDEEQWGSMDYRPSNLAQDVCELLEEHTERAPHISQEFLERMAHCCLGGLAEFLQSFQQRVERFHESPGIRELPSETYISRTISLVNCGPPLRSLAERLARVGPPESEPAREASAIALDRVTRLCHRVLAELLFQELQPHFNKLMRRKWLSSSEALDGIVGTLGAQALALRRMQDEPYQVCWWPNCTAGRWWSTCGHCCADACAVALRGPAAAWPGGSARTQRSCSVCFGGWSPRLPGSTRWCLIWPRSCSWRTLRASRWRSGCWCATTQTSGGSMWQPSWTSEDFETQLPARRFWRWPGTWNYLKVVPFRPLGTAPFLLTSPCPAHPSASASLTSWGASLSPGWPGPALLVCPCGLVLHRHLEPEPNAEAPGARVAAETPSSFLCDSLPETQTPGMGGALDIPPSPECPL